jgi:NAD(P)-dependent dehydrogenase (short-subunit alcohol dehydrogenase family)
MALALTSCQDKLSALQQKLQASSKNASSKIIYRTADVGDYEAVDAAVASAVEELGRIDILINNVSPLAIAYTINRTKKTKANTTHRPVSPSTHPPPSTNSQSPPSKQ